MENNLILNKRWSLVTWLFIPLLLVWLSTNYLIGVIHPDINWPSSDLPSQNSIKEVPIQQPKIVIPKYKWQGTGLVTLWFDDAWTSQYTDAFPILEKNGLKGALAVPTGLVGYDDYMGWSQIKRLQYKGWEITSHTRTHSCTLNKDSVAKVENELHGAEKDLDAEGLLNDNFVSPCGVSSPIMVQIAKKYYLSYRTSEPGFNNIPVDDPYNLLVQTMRSDVTIDQVQSWIDEAKSEKKWLIIMFHQVDTTKREYSVTPEKLSSVLNLIKQADLPVVLPSQALNISIDEIGNN